MPRNQFQLSASALAIGALLCGAAQAAEFDLGTPDAQLRLDTTLRYNLGVRTQKADPAILGNPNYDDGDRNFNKGRLVANRLDLLSEMDLVVEKRYGFRVSGALWTDAAYNKLNNSFAATANNLVGGQPAPGTLSSVTSRYAKGASGELLDAFVFGNFELGDMPLSVRAGRHTVYWGEALTGAGALHGISYGQYALDLWKGYATPGVEAKELFRPRNSVTAQLTPTPELTLGAQAFFDWEGARYPESGSYLTVNDALLNGGSSLVVGPNQRMLMGEIGKPKKSGDWGLSARWSPDWLDGTAGLYVRRTSDIQPQLTVAPAVATVPAATCGALGFTALAATTCYVNPAAATVPQILAGQVGQYRAFFGRDIDIYGLSLSKSLFGISVGAELSYRKNMPLNSAPVTVLPAKLVNPAAGQVPTTALDSGDIPGARGTTAHGVLSLIGTMAKTPLFDAASWSAEMVFNRWISVTQNAGAFKGGAPYTSNAANIDAVTKNYMGMGVNFTPTWFQVFPSVDISMPMAWSGGLKGNSAVMSGGNKNAGNFSIGVSADIRSKYSLALRYVGFYGSYTTTATGAMNVPNGVASALTDRGHALLTFKTTF
ncbi:DUF1302 domain-containing protein [Pelomonas sp. SE-A7]|uniref:DUF1302 domain-containing protein n=1 Tax=Pelomonas sp. SE-A7 TaxID=3054953 RepID=UPI00259CE151|nr:DUF1302 domain-containing protein [Pelomonas sp. SE-A7]MDM4765039.1 DUF1302 domain-containing protein [Pelomonas sp. SE-A7]